MEEGWKKLKEGTENSKIERELTSSKVDLYFMRSRSEGFREEPAGAHARHTSK